MPICSFSTNFSLLEHSDSEKIFRFDSIQRSLPYRRIGYYRLLCCQMSTLLRHHDRVTLTTSQRQQKKTNQRIGESIRIANRNALLFTPN